MKNVLNVKSIVSAINNGEFVESNDSQFLSYKSPAVSQLTTAFIFHECKEIDTCDKAKMDALKASDKDLFESIKQIVMATSCKIVYKNTEKHGWKVYIIKA